MQATASITDEVVERMRITYALDANVVPSISLDTYLVDLARQPRPAPAYTDYSLTSY